MAYFAELDNDNKVLRVISVSNEIVPDPAPNNEQDGIDFILNVLNLGGTWKQTSYNHNFRKNYAIIEGTYSQTLDAFIAPKPYDSWILNESTCQWDPPIAYPNDGKTYYWDEDTQEWVMK